VPVDFQALIDFWMGNYVGSSSSKGHYVGWKRGKQSLANFDVLFLGSSSCSDPIPGAAFPVFAFKCCKVLISGIYTSHNFTVSLISNLQAFLIVRIVHAVQ
jgi:hypothetical protein